MKENEQNSPTDENIIRKKGIIKGTPDMQHLLNDTVGKIHNLLSITDYTIKVHEKLSDKTKNECRDALKQTKFLLTFLLGSEFSSSSYDDEDLQSFFDFVGRNTRITEEDLGKSTIELKNGKFIFHNWAEKNTTTQGVIQILQDLGKKYKIEET